MLICSFLATIFPGNMQVSGFKVRTVNRNTSEYKTNLYGERFIFLNFWMETKKRVKKQHGAFHRLFIKFWQRPIRRTAASSASLFLLFYSFLICLHAESSRTRHFLCFCSYLPVFNILIHSRCADKTIYIIYNVSVCIL